MSTENTPVETVTDDLDAFAAELFGQSKAPEEQASSEEDKTEDVPEVDAKNDDDTHADADEDGDEAEDEGEEKQEDAEPEPKPKKSRAQERIEELNKKYRETERQLQEVLKKLEQNDKKPEPAPKQEKDARPDPNAQNEDGTDKYPLGEYDPNYIADLSKFSVEEQMAKYKAKDEAEEAQREEDKQKAALQSSWQEKVGPAQERYPDFQEKGEELLDTFAGIDLAYGEYLTATLMGMDFGPDVLYYLASNKDEAQKIVNSGPTKATIALGRLEAKFADANAEKQKARPKVSNAPVPPAHLNKGSAASQAEVPDDTDDLDAFAKKLFKKK